MVHAYSIHHAEGFFYLQRGLGCWLEPTAKHFLLDYLLIYQFSKLTDCYLEERKIFFNFFATRSEITSLYVFCFFFDLFD